MATSILRDITREYVDLDFSFARHPISSAVSVKRRLNAVKQSILHLMRLKSGDKLFHPEIKSPLYDFLFETTNPIIGVVIENEVFRYLSVYEPRAIISSVIVTFPSINAMSCVVVGTIINVQEEFTVNVLVDRLR